MTFLKTIKYADIRCAYIYAFLVLFQIPGSLAQSLVVRPYLQPGNASSLSKEEKVLIWQTDGNPAEFHVEYSRLSDTKEKVMEAKVTSVDLSLDNYKTRIYRADLSKLKFDARYQYRLTLSGKLIQQGEFDSRTRKPQTRFAIFGDCGAGTQEQAAIAWQVSQQKPQFVLLTGDIVYTRGRMVEYLARFFPYYLAAEPSPEKGASLMDQVPFYMTVGNHDIYSSNLDEYPDGLAFFYYSDLPKNGPLTTSTIQAKGADDAVKAFTKNTDRRFPRTTNFSFDHGNVHVVCIDGNHYANPLDPDFLAWLSADLRGTSADWKLVTFHEPPFSSSTEHYDDQWMRLLTPYLERLGVDLVVTGHEHNYQRTHPIKFAPVLDETGTRYVISKEGRVDGKFTLDENFNGEDRTKPDGIVYIVSGAGGAVLYDTALSNNPELWKHDPPENWVPFTVKLVSDVHSFTMVETNEGVLTLKQIDKNGNLIDRIRMTKK